jgi:hypothetical protein
VRGSKSPLNLAGKKSRAGHKEDDRLYFLLILGLIRRGTVEIYFLFPMSFSERLLKGYF